VVKLIKDKILKITFGIITFAIIAVVIGLLGFLIISGLDDINWEFLTAFPKNSMVDGGIFPAIVGSIYFLGVAMAFAIPVGILGAVYLSEYSKDNFFKRTLVIANNILSGIPSVVFGLFGLTLFCVTFGFGTSVIAGGLTLGLMSLPYVLSNTYESLIAVPDTYREASYALGASKVSTTFKVIIPSAGARILTGVVIAIGRIIGETAPILFTGAAFYITRNPTSIFEPAMSLPTHIYVLATIYPSNVQPKLEGTISVLLLIVIILFGFIGILRARDIRKRER